MRRLLFTTVYEVRGIREDNMITNQQNRNDLSKLIALAIPTFQTFTVPLASHCQSLLPMHSALGPQLPQTNFLFFSLLPPAPATRFRWENISC